MRRKLILILVFLPVIALVSILLGPRPFPVELAQVTKGPMQVMVESEGKTRIKNIYTISTPVAGRLLRLTYKAGDLVNAGESVLALIEPPNPEILDVRTVAEREAKVRSSAALAELAEADVHRADAALEYAKADLKRNESLIEKAFLSKQSLEKAQLEVKTKLAELAVARKNLQSRRSELDMNRAALLPASQSNQHANKSAPIKIIAQTSGKVLRILQESETTLNAGTPIMEIGDSGDLEIVLEMLSEYAAKVKIDAKGVISSWGGKPLNVKVRRIEPFGFTKVSALGIEEQRVNVLLELTDPDTAWQVLEHGYRVDAQIVVWEQDNILQIPMGALFRHKNQWAVYRVGQDHTAELRHVKIGQVNSKQAELIEGVELGDQLVLHPDDQLQTGVPVIQQPQS